MTALQVHLAMGHAPLVGVLFGLALLGYARLRRSEEVALAALVAFALLGVLSAAVYVTGGGAEEAVAGVGGIAPGRVAAHREAGLFSTVASAGLGMLALAELVLLRMRATPRAFKVLTFGAAVAVAAITAWATRLGDAVRHTEIGGPQSAVSADGSARGSGAVAVPVAALGRSSTSTGGSR